MRERGDAWRVYCLFCESNWIGHGRAKDLTVNVDLCVTPVYPLKVPLAYRACSVAKGNQVCAEAGILADLMQHPPTRAPCAVRYTRRDKMRWRTGAPMSATTTIPSLHPCEFV